MKKFAIFGSALLLGITLMPAVTLAHEEPGVLKAAAEVRVAEKKATTSARRTAQEEKREANRKEVIDRFADRVTERYHDSIMRMRTLADRIETRIGEIESKHDVDLSDARAKLATARTELNQAETVVNGIPAAVDTILATEDGTEVFADVREVLKNAHEEIRDGHQALVETLRLVKVALGLDEDH